MTVSSPAYAAGCAAPEDYHCYAVADFTVAAPSGFLGLDATYRTNCMTVGSYLTMLGTHEVWFAQVDPNNPDHDYYTEAGISVGQHVNADDPTPSTVPETFWADERPNGTYNEHWQNLPSYTLNTYHTVQVYKDIANTTTDHIKFDGVEYGESTNNFSGASNNLQGGLETSTDTYHTYGSLGALRWRDLQGTWHGGWENSTGLVHAELERLGPGGGSNFSPLSWASGQTYIAFRSGAGPTC